MCWASHSDPPPPKHSYSLLSDSNEALMLPSTGLIGQHFSWKLQLLTFKAFQVHEAKFKLNPWVTVTNVLCASLGDGFTFSSAASTLLRHFITYVHNR